MSLGITVMVIIIALNIVALIGVMYLGSRHDAHHDLHEVESFDSINKLKEKGYKIFSATPPTTESTTTSGEEVVATIEGETESAGTETAEADKNS